VGAIGDDPSIVLCVAAAMAACVAGLALPPQIDDQAPEELPGSPVMPETEITRAAAIAPASAARCASMRAR
jgi:hypothetical protein